MRTNLVVNPKRCGFTAGRSQFEPVGRFRGSFDQNRDSFPHSAKGAIHTSLWAARVPDGLSLPAGGNALRESGSVKTEIRPHRAPKAQPIPAWGTAPGNRAPDGQGQ